jgi:hypothetical protein
VLVTVAAHAHAHAQPSSGSVLILVVILTNNALCLAVAHHLPGFCFTTAPLQIDMEYLKNLVLQLYTTGEAEALLPVFGRLLVFGPEELRRATQGLERLQTGQEPLPAAAAVVDSAGSLISSWLGWGTSTTTLAAAPAHDAGGKVSSRGPPY